MSARHQVRFVSSVAAAIVAMPFLIYAGARFSGFLPSPEFWARAGQPPHGPWHSSLPGWIFIVSLIAVGLLALAAVVIGSLIAVRARSVRVLAFTGVLVAAAVSALVWYLETMAWVIR